MERVKLSKTGLAKDVENGLTRKEIANKYGLVQGQLNRAMVQAGLKGVKAKTVKFEFVEEDEATEEVAEETAAMPEIPMEFPATFGTPTTNAMPLGRDF